MDSRFDPDAFRDFDRQGHDRLAASYTDVFTPITCLAIGHLLDAAEVRTGTRMLDVACGPGLACRAAQERGADAIGIDLSPRMIEIARHLLPDIRFYVGDVERLPFPGTSFGAVVCNFGLGHFPRPEASAAECVRVLTPGGSLAFAWWDNLQKQRLQAIFREALTEANVKPSPNIPVGHDMFRFSDSNALRRLLEDAGLEDVAIQDFTSSIDVADAEQLWGIGMGSLAVTSSMILDTGAATRIAVRQAFDRIAEAYRHGAGLTIPVAFKVSSGRKPGLAAGLDQMGAGGEPEDRAVGRVEARLKEPEVWRRGLTRDPAHLTLLV